MKKTKYYKCISLQEKEVNCWAVSFSIGNIYELLLDDKSNTIMLYSEYNNPLWVDRDCFIEVSNDGKEFYNRKTDLQRFFINANATQEEPGFDLDQFTDEYIKRNPAK